MRTLKKTLCLVLALVMMLGLCAVSASATSFSDDAQIEDDYREAIEVLNAIGVYNGKGDGSLGPKDQLTRVQGCQLICNMLGAPNGAGFTSFTDVNASDSAVVAYCQTLGLVHGNGDNTFSPNDPLTGAAFAKFCLVALGYNCALEGITGSDWLAATQQLTIATGLAKGINGYNQANPMTREQAGQMLLNTLQATMVQYRNGVEISTKEGVDVTVAGTRINQTNTSNDDYRLNQGNPNVDYTTKEFCEAYFPQLKKNNAASLSDADDMYIPVKYAWNYRGSETYRVYNDAVVTYTGSKNATAVSADLSGYYLRDGGTDKYINNASNVNIDGATVTVYVNGVPAGTAIGNVTAGTGIAGTGGQTLAKEIADLTANGREVALYATNSATPNMITDIVITCYTVAKVDDVKATNSTTTEYRFATADSGSTLTVAARKVYTDAPADNQLFCDTALAKGDYVTLTYAQGSALNNTTTLYAFKATPVTGTQSQWTSNDKVTVSGTTYDVAKGVAKNDAYATKLTAAADFNNNSEGVFYIDQFGYLVHSEAVAINDYCFIVGASNEIESGLDGATPVVKVRAVLSNGTVGVYTVKTENAGSTVVYPISGTSYASPTPTALANAKVIANTDILVSFDGAGSSAPLNTSALVSDAARILMSDHYGYVYKYTLSGDTITLYPMEYKSGGYTDYKANASAAPLTADRYYAGQTSTKIVKGQVNYNNTHSAGGTTTNTPAENAWYTPGSANAANAVASPAVEDITVVVGSNTPVIIYDSKDKTARVVTGLGELPTSDSNSSYGYYAAKARSATVEDAQVLFIAKDYGIVTESKELIYIDASKYTRANGTDGDYYIYTSAFHENGETFSVTDPNSVVGTPGAVNSGVYYVNANGVVIEKLINNTGTTEGAVGYSAPSVGTPWVLSSNVKVEGGMIKGDTAAANGTTYWYTSGSTTVAIDSSKDPEIDGSHYVILVLEVANGNLTGYVKTMYIIPTATYNAV